MSTPKTSQEREFVFETLKVRRESGVLFVEISAPPMNLEGQQLTQAAMASGFQMREAELNLAQLVSDIQSRPMSEVE